MRRVPLHHRGGGGANSRSPRSTPALSDPGRRPAILHAAHVLRREGFQALDLVPTLCVGTHRSRRSAFYVVSSGHPITFPGHNEVAAIIYALSHGWRECRFHREPSQDARATTRRPSVVLRQNVITAMWASGLATGNGRATSPTSRRVRVSVCCPGGWSVGRKKCVSLFEECCNELCE